ADGNEERPRGAERRRIVLDDQGGSLVEARDVSQDEPIGAEVIAGRAIAGTAVVPAAVTVEAQYSEIKSSVGGVVTRPGRHDLAVLLEGDRVEGFDAAGQVDLDDAVRAELVVRGAVVGPAVVEGPVAVEADEREAVAIGADDDDPAVRLDGDVSH